MDNCISFTNSLLCVIVKISYNYWGDHRLSGLACSSNFSLLVFVCCSTLGFEAKEPVFYPLISQTNKVENYLIIDNGVINEENEKMLRDIFPKSIPNEASEITYDYFYGAGDFSMSISAKWKLPYEIYNKNRKNYKLTELKEMKNSYIYTEYSSITSCFCSVIFYDDDQAIEYKFQQ